MNKIKNAIIDLYAEMQKAKIQSFDFDIFGVKGIIVFKDDLYPEDGTFVFRETNITRHDRSPSRTDYPLRVDQ